MSDTIRNKAWPDKKQTVVAEFVCLKIQNKNTCTLYKTVSVDN